MKNFVQSLFLFFVFSCLNFLFLCFLVQQISVKKQTTKMEKSSPKNKNGTNKSIQFLVKTFFGLVFSLIRQKKASNLS